MRKQLPALLLFATAVISDVHGASGNLVVFDDADRNGFDHLSSIYSYGAIFYNATSPVHSGGICVAGQNTNDTAASWLAPAIYSTLSDYDGVSFWVNGGSDGGENITVVLYNGNDLVGTESMADLYGAPIPVETWIHLQLSFSSPVFNPNGQNSTMFDNLAFRNHSGGSGYFYLDDIALTGADIFKSGFE